MIEITEFINKPREERRAHLNLNEPCCERGGNSTNHKGVLAQYLDTTIPSGRILLCHACNNGKCSNPKHLYWGTDYDNTVIDGTEFNTYKNPWLRTIEKYGHDKTLKLKQKQMVGNTFGAGNKDKPKSEKHKQNISKSISAKKKTGTLVSNGGRKRKMPYDELIALVSEHGIRKTAELLNESYEGVRSRYYTAKKKLTEIK